MTLKFRKYLPRICTSSISECCAVICVDPEYVSRYFRLPSVPRSFSISIFLYIYISSPATFPQNKEQSRNVEEAKDFTYTLTEKNVVRRFVI